MKTLAGTTLLCALLGTLAPLGTAFAETEDDSKVLLEDTYLESGYTSIAAKIVKGGAATSFASAQGAWELAPQLSAGISGDFLMNRVAVDRDGASHLNLVFLGAFAEYQILEKDVFAVLGSFGFGWGQATYDVAEAQAALATGDARKYEKSTLFYVEPDATGLVHVSHRVDLALTLGYRYARGAKIEGVNPEDFGGVSAAFGLRGRF